MTHSNEIPVVPILKPDEGCRLWLRSTQRRVDRSARRLPELNILICTSGRLRYFINGNVLHMRPRSMLMAQPGDSHFLISESRDADLIVAAIDPDILQGAPTHPPIAFSDGSASRQLRLLGEGAFREVSNLTSSLIETTDTGASMIGSRWWLHRVWTFWQASEHQNPAGTHTAVAIALTLLRDDPRLSISEIATVAGVNADHLSSLFKKQVGVPMVRYRTKQRIDTVERLVLNDGLSLGVAAERVGFNDYSTFYRAFRKEREDTPDSIRKSA